MAAPIVPEAEAPNPNPQPINPLKAELDDLQRNALSTLHSKLEAETRKNALLEARLNDTRDPPRALTGADFLNDPIPIIQAEMQKTVKPLVDFVSQMQNDNKYASAKAKLKSQYPNLGTKFAELEPYIDGYMNGIEPTPENIQAVFTQVIGLQQLGQIPSSSAPIPAAPIPSSVPNPSPIAPNMTQVPPVIAPSPPSLPNRGGPANTPEAIIKAKVDAMTEDERTIARKWGQTPESYVQYRDAPSDVASWGDIK